MPPKKNSTQQNPSKQKSYEQPLVKARIDRLVNLEDSKIKAYASVTIGNTFAVLQTRPTACLYLCHKAAI